MRRGIMFRHCDSLKIAGPNHGDAIEIGSVRPTGVDDLPLITTKI
jgi:hypothetical protein